MKKNIATLFLTLLFISGFCQNTRFEYGGKRAPAIKKERLNEARFISQIMPGFSRYVALPYKDYSRMNDLLKIVDPKYMYRLGNYVHILEDYEKIIDYVSIEISAINQGKLYTAQSTSDVLTSEQKNILRAVDLGSVITIKIKFNFKGWTRNTADTDTKLKEGIYSVTVVPETDAVYPGGFKEITAYLTTSVINKIAGPTAYEKLQKAVVKFTVTEEGKLINTKMDRTSTDPHLDKLILDAINKMPQWMPANDSRGLRVKQEISIPFGRIRDGC